MATAIQGGSIALDTTDAAAAAPPGSSCAFGRQQGQLLNISA
jgi:hypothetical protein